MNHYNHKNVVDDCDKVATTVLAIATIAGLIGVVIVCL